MILIDAFFLITGRPGKKIIFLKIHFLRIVRFSKSGSQDFFKGGKKNKVVA